MMRILSSAVIVAVAAFSVGCGAKSDTPQTTPPAQAGPAAAAGRQGGAPPAPAPVTVVTHAATMKAISQAVPTAAKALKGADTATATTNLETVATSFATLSTRSG